jgi:hypothetical protein
LPYLAATKENQSISLFAIFFVRPIFIFIFLRACASPRLNRFFVAQIDPIFPDSLLDADGFADMLSRSVNSGVLQLSLRRRAGGLATIT